MQSILRSVAFLITILLATTALAQNGTVRGHLYDKTSGEPILYGNVLIEEIGEGTVTDENGFFQFKNVELNSRGSLIKVEKQGYFYNAKFVNAELNSQNFTKFKLIEKTSIGFVSSAMGGELSTNDGATISLTANSISDENGNALINLVALETKSKN